MTRVIRADSDGQRVVPAVVGEAAERARLIVLRAKAEADEILARARAQVERLSAEARERGREQGLASLATAFAELETTRQQSLARLEPDAVRIALVAAEQIVGEELGVRPDKVRAIVAPLIERLRRSSVLTLRLHPEDAPIVQQHLLQLLADSESNARVQIESDAAIARGGCMAVSDIGSLDARVESRLEVMAQRLTPQRLIER
jgi:flagellar assembly protein FliH